jgi:hypothetical protein
VHPDLDDAVELHGSKARTEDGFVQAALAPRRKLLRLDGQEAAKPTLELRVVVVDTTPKTPKVSPFSATLPGSRSSTIISLKMLGSLSSLLSALVLLAGPIAAYSPGDSDDRPLRIYPQRAPGLAPSLPGNSSEERNLPCAETTDDDDDHDSFGDRAATARHAARYRWASRTHLRHFCSRFYLLSTAPKTSPPRE